MKRRTFLKRAVAVPALGASAPLEGLPASPTAVAESSRHPTPESRIPQKYFPGRIPNEYSLYLSDEREALSKPPSVAAISGSVVQAKLGSESKPLQAGEAIGGWQLVVILGWLNGTPTAVFEKHETHQGAIAYVTEMGEIARIPKRIGDLSKIRPRPVNNPHGVKLERPARYVPGPDVCGDYILNSDEDPSYENVAALGEELIGWTLVANEESAPEKSLWLEADGKSRQLPADAQTPWAPDLTGRLFDPRRVLPSEYLYEYVPGYSKRTLLGGYLPAADIGVWNPKFHVGYEVMMVMPEGADAKPIARIRAQLPPGRNGKLIPPGDSGYSGTGPDQIGAGVSPVDEHGQAPGQNLGSPSHATFSERYWNGSAEDFFTTLAGVRSKWQHFFEDRMKVEIPDEWLLDAARAGIVLSRCSYHGLEPTYQIGEGAYTKVPVRSHALFPVALYEFVWAQQLWNLTDQVEPYFEHYLKHYILEDGNFMYNTQDQVEAPLNAGVFLGLSARAYDYTHDVDAFRRRVPVLRRVIEFVLRRYRYSKSQFPTSDPRHGLIWGSPEADNGDPHDDFPESHPYYYQNAAWIWRGLHEHARALARAGREHNDDELTREAATIEPIAAEMRADIGRSLRKTLDDRNADMKLAGITPFTPFDTSRKPTDLSSYENHRYMMDWWTADWGDASLDAGHFKHRSLAGQQILGMNTDGDYPRTSNFMEHGTLAGRIRQDDYRPFLLALYANLCYAMDSGSRYAPEDALLPGNFPGEGSPYAWSAVVNSVLQPTMGLRWLLCYEEHHRSVVHLQKAAPKHWFAAGERIHVESCPTRFGPLSWTTETVPGEGKGMKWRVEIQLPSPFEADLIVHIHPPNRQALKSTSLGELQRDRIVLPASIFTGKRHVVVEISS